MLKQAKNFSFAAHSAPERATTNPNDWTWEKARHLLFRAGFGGRQEEIETTLR